jgi:hypothetical protein
MANRELLGGLRSPKSILARQIDWLNAFYRAALAQRGTTCPICGGPAAIDYQLPPYAPRALTGPHGLTIRCSSQAHCDNVQPLHYLVLDIPEVQQFWRRHPRMRLAGERELQLAGRDATLVAFERADGAARIEVVSAADTFEVLAVERTS